VSAPDLEQPPALTAVLLFEESPTRDPGALLAILADDVDGVVGPAEHGDETGLVYHPGHLWEVHGVHGTAATALVGPRAIETARWGEFVRHSRRCPEVRPRLERCRIQLGVVEMFGRPLPPSERQGLFARVVDALIGELAPSLIVSVPTQEILDPVRLTGDPAMLVANVRLVRVDGTDTAVMDTVGLSALGLPDVQMVFGGLEHDQVAGYLYDVALHLYEHGDVIEDGQTIEGVEPGTAWRCGHVTSLLKPSRTVLHIDPGSPYARRPPR
jgi:hypothetical protein